MKHTFLSAQVRTLTLLSLVAAIVFAISISKDFSSSAQKLEDGKRDAGPEILLTGDISGRVYQDFNSNGARDTAGGNSAIDTGVAGVTVTAYDSAGAPSGSAVSGTDGTYTIVTSGTGPYRLEFTTLPAGYQPSGVGTNNASTVKFVANGTSGGHDLGVILPTNYCQTTPMMAFNVYNIGPAAVDTIVRFPYTFSQELDGRLNSIDPTAWTAPPSRTALLDPTGVADADAVGATFGLTYNGRTSRLYSAAYLKRGTNFGSLSGESTGAIYVTNNPSGSPSTSLYVDLNSPSVFGAGTAGANPHPAATDFTTDAATPPFVGKRALGGLRLSADGANLYTVNLNDRRLYVIPTSGTLNSTTITRFDIPTAGLPTSSGNCNAADVRPFAVGRDSSGQIYVGAVCSAESEASDAKLHAYIWRFTGSAFTLVANNTLTFARDAGLTNVATWRRWDNTSTGLFRPSPMLTDIEFDGSNMILGFRDRYGDMTVLPDFNRGYGDIMRVCNVAGTFTFESNATCGGVTSTDPTGNNNTGNGGREFYTDRNADAREEGGWGGLTQVPGYDHHVTTMYDPVTFNSAGTRVTNFYTGGVQRYNNTTGLMTGAYDVYLQDGAGGGNFGKANGGGDSEVLCDAAPLEIGNRVWRDINGNGVQDPGELSIPNVTISLWADTNTDGAVDTQVGTAVTDANGNYIFGGVNNSNLPPYACGTPATADVRVNSSTDDAEQQTAGGAVVLNSNDLDFFGETDGAGTAYSNLGVRFNNLNIPQGSTITSASIEFTANNSATVSAGNPTITIQGQNVDNAATFATTANDISGRTWLAGQDVIWNPGTWTNGTTTNTTTPSLTNIVQAIVNRGSWASGNSMAFRFTGTSTAALYREAESFDGNNAAAPRLVVQYTPPVMCTRRVEPNTAYQVRFDNPANYAPPAGPLFGLLLTRLNETSQNGDDDSSDSDALTIGNPPGSPAGNFPVISLTTGGPGANNHTFDVGFAAVPTAAGVSVEGRVMLQAGNGVRNAMVILTEADGTQHTALTGTFGYYRFDDIEVGQTVVVSVRSKRFIFNPPSRIVSLTDGIANLDFIAKY